MWSGDGAAASAKLNLFLEKVCLLLILLTTAALDKLPITLHIITTILIITIIESQWCHDSCLFLGWHQPCSSEPLITIITYSKWPIGRYVWVENYIIYLKPLILLIVA